MSEQEAAFAGVDEPVMIDLQQQASGDVQANVVRMAQSAARHIEGEAVRMEQSAA
jgi:hypothetical protein